MSNFSLSPGVSVKEYNLTGYVPNIPSAKTGMILRADQGPAMDVTSVTSEIDLVTVFGKPTASNYQDWFQAWNFLQYSSSLYVVRPIDANGVTENAGVGVSYFGKSDISKPNFYNSNVAHHSLENFSDKSDALYFINKEVTSNQKLALSICSSPDSFKKQLGLEYYAIANTVNGTTTVTSTGTTPTLTNGSQVIFNGNKLATVKSVIQSSATSGSVIFDRAVSAVDVDAFYAVPSSSTVTTVGTNFIGSFYKSGFTFKIGTRVNTNFVVTSVGNNTVDSTVYDVTFINVSGSAAPTFTIDVPVSSSTVYYTGTTAYNTTTGDFGVTAGDTSISLQSGFILEAGVTFTISGQSSTVASVDTTLNKIMLTAPLSGTIASSGSIALAITSSTAVDKVIIGINYFDRVYDSGLIKKTRVSVTDVSGTTKSIIAQSLVPFNVFFDFPPNWTNDEFAVIVLSKNTDGYYEKSESFIVSYNPSAKNQSGTNIFVENVFNKVSKTLYAKIGDTYAIRPSTANLPIIKIVHAADYSTIYPKKGGSSWDQNTYDASKYVQGDIMQAYTLFADPEQFDINILQCHELDTNYASTIAETRKDCIAVVAPYDSQILANESSNDCTAYLLDNFGTQTEFDEKIFTAFGTYSAFYGNMKFQYDKFNNVNRWINITGDICGLYAQTDNTNDPWWAAAGTTRGIIRNAIKLAFNPSKQNRDDLYVNGINPIMAIAGQGSAVVFGQKTTTATPSAMDRVNVRRLLIFLEKSISIASNIGLFEFNDKFTRTRLFNIIDPFLRSVKAKRGLIDYKIVIDESNNTSQVIDQNGLKIDIYLMPNKVTEFILVSAVVVNTGANFSEVTGTF